jgi:hypothetical protein
MRKALMILVGLSAVLAMAIVFKDSASHSEVRRSNPPLHVLRVIEGAKQQWIMECAPASNAWPAEADIMRYVRGDRLEDEFPSQHGEIYIVNRADRPAAVYLPTTAYGMRGRQLLTLEDIQSAQYETSQP